MIACVNHVVGDLWFLVAAMAIVALPVAALAHLNGEHVERRRQRLARRHPVNEPPARTCRPLHAPELRTMLAAANQRHDTTFYDQDGQR